MYLTGLADNNENGGLKLADDKKPYSTLGYANGPGSFVSVNATVRPNITLTNMGRYQWYTYKLFSRGVSHRLFTRLFVTYDIYNICLLRPG